MKTSIEYVMQTLSEIEGLTLTSNGHGFDYRAGNIIYKGGIYDISTELEQALLHITKALAKKEQDEINGQD